MTLTLTQHIVTMAKNAIELIQKEASTFVSKVKTGYDGLDTDLITTADIAAQTLYQQYIEEYFPEEGMIGEEDLNKVGTNYRYFTIDPLDGTKAFGRKQSTGVGTMIAHVNEFGIVDAVCVGDVNTGELFYFGPDKTPTRIRFGVETTLGIPEGVEVDNLHKMYISLRNHTETFPKLVQDFVRQDRGGIFKDLNIESGSIGIYLTRLWKHEVGLVVMAPSFETPWDMTPIVGMNKVLGIVHITLNKTTLEVEIIDKPVLQQAFRNNSVELITYKQYVPQILTWIEGWKKKNM